MGSRGSPDPGMVRCDSPGSSRLGMWPQARFPTQTIPPRFYNIHGLVSVARPLMGSMGLHMEQQGIPGLQQLTGEIRVDIWTWKLHGTGMDQVMWRRAQPKPNKRTRTWTGA